jgi:hypothetical protein
MLVTFSMLSTPEAHERHTRWAPTVEEGSIRQQLSTLSVQGRTMFTSFFVPSTAFPPPQCGITPLIRISTPSLTLLQISKWDHQDVSFWPPRPLSSRCGPFWPILALSLGGCFERSPSTGSGTRARDIIIIKLINYIIYYSIADRDSGWLLTVTDGRNLRGGGPSTARWRPSAFT